MQMKLGGLVLKFFLFFTVLINSKEIEEFRSKWLPGESSLHLHDLFCECSYLMHSYVVADVQHEGWAVLHLHRGQPCCGE